ncbi:MAG: hypothetical protein BGO39_28635 [Chloroflexi bacterium 54-19]|nr:MAG: hypothetical protein BGO39_28635 [Chloroflexi bacterium 54-19]
MLEEPTRSLKDEPHFVGERWCPLCGHRWVQVVHWKTRGIECPNCHHSDPEYSWLGTFVDEQEEKEKKE